MLDVYLFKAYGVNQLPLSVALVVGLEESSQVLRIGDSISTKENVFQGLGLGAVAKKDLVFHYVIRDPLDYWQLITLWGCLLFFFKLP